jgi:hypothetical protein
MNWADLGNLWLEDEASILQQKYQIVRNDRKNYPNNLAWIEEYRECAKKKIIKFLGENSNVIKKMKELMTQQQQEDDNSWDFSTDPEFERIASLVYNKVQSDQDMFEIIKFLDKLDIRFWSNNFAFAILTFPHWLHCLSFDFCLYVVQNLFECVPRICKALNFDDDDNKELLFQLQVFKSRRYYFRMNKEFAETIMPILFPRVLWNFMFDDPLISELEKRFKKIFDKQKNFKSAAWAGGMFSLYPNTKENEKYLCNQDFDLFIQVRETRNFTERAQILRSLSVLSDFSLDDDAEDFLYSGKIYFQIAVDEKGQKFLIDKIIKPDAAPLPNEIITVNFHISIKDIVEVIDDFDLLPTRIFRLFNNPVYLFFAQDLCEYQKYKLPCLHTSRQPNNANKEAMLYRMDKYQRKGFIPKGVACYCVPEKRSWSDDDS